MRRVSLSPRTVKQWWGQANTDAELYKLSSGEDNAHENLGLKNSPFCLRKSQQTPCGRAFLLKVTWWENLASYYRSHLRTSCFWGGVCVCKCACVCAHTKTPFDGRGFFLILEVLNKSWLLTKYTSHLTIDRASRQHTPPPPRGLGEPVSWGPFRISAEANKSRSWSERLYGPCPAFLNTLLPASFPSVRSHSLPCPPFKRCSISLDALFLKGYNWIHKKA